MKIANTEEENLHILWTTWKISMKLSGKMWLITLNVTKKQCFTLSVENTFFEKPERERERENVNWPPSRSELRLPGKHPGKYLNHQSPGSVQIFECIIPSAACVRIRSSQWSCSFKKGVLWNFTKNTRKHRC